MSDGDARHVKARDEKPRDDDIERDTATREKPAREKPAREETAREKPAREETERLEAKPNVAERATGDRAVTDEAAKRATPADAVDAREQRIHDRRSVSAGKVLNWLVLLLVLTALAVLAFGIVREFLPRRWAEEIVAIVDGTRIRGLLYGFGVGLVFTLIPLLVLAQARRRFFNWTWRLIVLVVALLLAAPNWLTIAVAIGRSRSSIDGRILLDQSGQGFRDGSAGGAIVGGVLALIFIAFSLRLSQRRRQVLELRAKVDQLQRQVTRKEDPASSKES